MVVKAVESPADCWFYAADRQTGKRALYGSANDRIIYIE